MELTGFEFWFIVVASLIGVGTTAFYAVRFVVDAGMKVQDWLSTRQKGSSEELLASAVMQLTKRVNALETEQEEAFEKLAEAIMELRQQTRSLTNKLSRLERDIKRIEDVLNAEEERESGDLAESEHGSVSL